MRVMFDTNVYDVLEKDVSQLGAITNKCEVYTTVVQENELRRIKDKSKRESIDKILKVISPKQVAAPFSFDNIDFGLFRFSCGQYEGLIEGNSRQMSNDSLIADAAIENDCILITNDKRLATRMRVNDFQVLEYDEFIAKIMES